MAAQPVASTRITLLHRLNERPDDQANWAEFVTVYGPAIRQWCLHWGLQESDAQDVSQNVLFRLTTRLPNFKYDKSKSFRGWLKTLTHHAWHDFITEAGYRHRGSGDTGIYEQLHSAEAKTDLAARVEAAFDKELLELAVTRVKERVAAATWEAFKLTAFDGATPQDAADTLGMRVSQVYLAKHRVQKQLQEEITALEAAE
jgi:RNA polymerase sigma factor (sigma-70 family)